MKKCYVSNLEPYRKMMLGERNLMLGSSILFAALCIWFVAINKKELLIPFLLLFFAAIILFGAAMDKNKLLKQFYAIDPQKTHDIILYKPTVKFFTHATSYSAFTRSPRNYVICAIRLRGDDGKKYYCFLDHDIPYNNITVDRIKQKLWRKLTVSCYDNTNIVKLIEDDPYFFRIR